MKFISIVERSLTYEERVLLKILHKQTSSTRSGLDYTLLYNRAVDWDWVKETSRQEIDIQVFLDYNKFS